MFPAKNGRAMFQIESEVSMDDSEKSGFVFTSQSGYQIHGCGGQPARSFLKGPNDPKNRVHYDPQFNSYLERLTALMASTQTSDAPSSEASAFDSLSLELFRLQFTHNPAYQSFCRHRGIQRAEDVSHVLDVPAIPTTAYKQSRLSCLPLESVTREFHSSGTTDHTPSRHAHSPRSLALYENSLLLSFEQGLISQPPQQDQFIVSLTPSAHIAPHSSLAHMCQVVCDRWGNTDSRCLGTIDAMGTWSVDIPRVIESAQLAIASHRPLGILGTAFNWVHLLDSCAARHIHLTLPEGSWAMETGGYKGRSRILSKFELHQALSERLGIRAERIVCEYGMSELSSQAYDGALIPEASEGVVPTKRRCFRFPPWARSRIVSPENGDEVADGAVGIIQVFDLANAFSVLAVQTEDLGRRCGDGFELIGRIADAEARGCSLLAKAIP